MTCQPQRGRTALGYLPDYLPIRQANKPQKQLFSQSVTRAFTIMCQPISYVYPDCGHYVAARHVWTLERCMRAHRYGRDCWIPRDYALRNIEKRPWPGQPLDPCKVCIQRLQSNSQGGGGGGGNDGDGDGNGQNNGKDGT